MMQSILMVRRSSFDHTARLWDADSGACLKIFTDHIRPIYTLSFSPDGHWLATGSGDGYLHVYSVMVRCLLSQLDGAESLRTESEEDLVMVRWSRQTECIRDRLANNEEDESYCTGPRIPTSWGH